MSLTTRDPLTAAQMARLAALQNRATRYEIEVRHPDGRAALLGYTARKSRPGLLGQVRPAAEAICGFLGVPLGAGTSWAKGGALTVANGGTIRFSGRTQRDAICSGELPALPTGEG